MVKAMTEVDRPIIDMKLDKKRSTKNKRVYSGGSVDTAAVLDAIRPKPKMGRPSAFTPEVRQQVLDHIASGKSVAEISRMEGMPSDWTVFQTVAKDADFARDYMCAREKQQFVLADRALAIAAGTDPLCFREGPEGVEMLDAAERRLIMDTLVERCRSRPRARSIWHHYRQTSWHSSRPCSVLCPSPPMGTNKLCRAG
jgi:hypothetical protein